MGSLGGKFDQKALAAPLGPSPPAYLAFDLIERQVTATVVAQSSSKVGGLFYCTRIPLLRAMKRLM